jgi:hypothetical protein
MQFLRAVAIVFLVLIGFGFGLCGLFGLGVTLLSLVVSGWQHGDECSSSSSASFPGGRDRAFFAVRALARRFRAARELRRASTARGRKLGPRWTYAARCWCIPRSR